MSTLQDDIRVLRQKIDEAKKGLETRLSQRISEVIEQFTVEAGIEIESIKVELAHAGSVSHPARTVVRDVTVTLAE